MKPRRCPTCRVELAASHAGLWCAAHDPDTATARAQERKERGEAFAKIRARVLGPTQAIPGHQTSDPALDAIRAEIVSQDEQGEAPATTEGACL